MNKPGFYEFFAGGGMARAGLGDDWECLFANDFDAKKAACYVANWGDREFRLGDVHKLAARDIPGRADLAWASFPCQDLSLAGNGKGLAGERSGAFWGFWNVLHGLKTEGRAPKILVLENVAGALTSNCGQDFQEICGALRALNYVFGALTIDAVHFVPQSRPRLFVVAVARAAQIGRHLSGDGPAPDWASGALVRAYAELRPDLKSFWKWWRLPAPPRQNAGLDTIEENAPPDVAWHDPEQTGRLLGMMSAPNLEKLRRVQALGQRTVGTIYRRTRHEGGLGRVQRAEIRFDGIAGCLRTPGGGSSRQVIAVVEGACVRTRLLSGREAARLMGLPDSYLLPARYNDAYHLVGDGVAVPVVRFLAEWLLLPMLAAERPFAEAAE